MKRNNEIKYYITNNILDLEKVINEYSGYVYKIIKNMSKSIPEEDVEEILSDTFFILWKNRDSLDEQRPLSSYIAGIVRNLLREKTRKIHIDYDISDYENIISDINEIEMEYEQREKISTIEKSLSNMKKEDVDIFNMYYYSAIKIKEISHILNISEFGVKSKLYRIRKKIKKDLEKGGYSYGK